MTKCKVCLLLQAVCLALLAVMLAASAVRVYRDGTARRAEDPLESIYTPEIAAQKLKAAAPLFVFSAGLAAFCLARGFRDGRAEKPVRDPEIVRDLAAARVSRPTEEMTRERGRQKNLLRAGWGTFALCMIPPAAYLADAGHFPERDPEGMFCGLVSVLLPFAALGLCALAAAYILREKSMERETKAARTAAQAEKAGESRIPEPRRNARQDIARLVIAALAVALIVAGVLNGSALDVLVKAITICTECVGLG